VVVPTPRVDLMGLWQTARSGVNTRKSDFQKAYSGKHEGGEALQLYCRPVRPFTTVASGRCRPAASGGGLTSESWRPHGQWP